MTHADVLFDEYIHGKISIEDFDLHAQDPAIWKDLSDRIPGLIISSAGGFSIYEASGLIHGHPFYYRRSSSESRLQVGSSDGDAKTDYLYHSVLKEEKSPLDENFIEREAFESDMIYHVNNLAITPFRYSFASKRVIEDYNGKLRTDGSKIILTAWGQTPKDAFNALMSPRNGSKIPIHKQKAILALAEPNPNPLNIDKRVFPTVHPHFRVLY